MQNNNGSNHNTDRYIDNNLKRVVHSKRAYNIIKSITDTKSKTTSIIEDKYGTPLADDLTHGNADGLNTANISTITKIIH